MQMLLNSFEGYSVGVVLRSALPAHSTHLGDMKNIRDFIIDNSSCPEPTIVSNYGRIKLFKPTRGAVGSFGPAVTLMVSCQGAPHECPLILKFLQVIETVRNVLSIMPKTLAILSGRLQRSY